MAVAWLGIKSVNKEVKTEQRNNIFWVKAFQFTKFHENEEAFKVKNVQNYWKFGLRFFKLIFFVGKQPNYYKIFLITSEITKLEKY